MQSYHIFGSWHIIQVGSSQNIIFKVRFLCIREYFDVMVYIQYRELTTALILQYRQNEMQNSPNVKITTHELYMN